MQKYLRLVMSLALPLLAASLCSACSGKSESQSESLQLTPPATPQQQHEPGPGRSLPAAELNLAVPPLPAASERLAGSIVSLCHPAAAALKLSTLAQANPADGSLLLTSEPEPQALALCWAMYRFESLSPGDLPAMLRASLAGTLPQQVYLAVSDYSAGCWRWTSISAPAAEVTAVAAGQDALDGFGNLYCIVAVCGGETATLSQICLEAEIALPPPEDFSSSSDRSDGIALSWTDPALSYDPDGAGPLTFSYDRIVVERGLSPQGPWTQIAEAVAAETTLLLTGPDPPLPPNLPLYLRLRTCSAAALGPPGNPQRGMQVLAGPTGVSASDGDFADSILISWDALPGASAYDVYCQRIDPPAGSGSKLGRVSETQFTHRTYAPVYPLDLVHYRYWVAAQVGQYMTALSSPDSGFRRMIPPTNVTASQGTSLWAIDVSWDALPAANNYVLKSRRESDPPGKFYFQHVTGTQKTLSYSTLNHSNDDYRYEVAVDDGSDVNLLPYSEPAYGHLAYLLHAYLSVSPMMGSAPITATLDAAGSGNPDTSIVSYDWDFEGDGVFDLSTGADESQVVHTYPTGIYSPVVRVNDDSPEQVVSDPVGIASGGWFHYWGGPRTDRTFSIGTDAMVDCYSLALFDTEEGLVNAILKRNAQGSLLWAKGYGLGVSYTQIFSVCPDGSLFLGNTEYPGIQRVQSSGQPLWSVIVHCPLLGDFARVADLSPLNNNELLIACFGSTTASGGIERKDAVIALDADANVLWGRSISSVDPAEGFEQSCLCTDSAGRLVIGGALTTSGLGALISVDSTLNIEWQCSIPDSYVRDIAADTDGRVYVLLHHQTDASAQSGASGVLALEADGSVAWLSWMPEPIYMSRLSISDSWLVLRASGGFTLLDKGGATAQQFNLQPYGSASGQCAAMGQSLFISQRSYDPWSMEQISINPLLAGAELQPTAFGLESTAASLESLQALDVKDLTGIEDTSDLTNGVLLMLQLPLP